jgi:hypothetical protein
MIGMCRIVKALVIDPSSRRLLTPNLCPGVDDIRESIGGGWYDVISGDGWQLYYDHNGAGKGLPVNRLATLAVSILLRRRLEHQLHGPVVMFGQQGSGMTDAGRLVDIPAGILITVELIKEGLLGR